MIPRSILLIVTKNTAVLDFALPLLHRMRQVMPDANISVLYCVINKKSILRQSTYYSEALQKDHIQEYDLADFLCTPLNLLKIFFQSLLSRSRKDSFALDKYALLVRLQRNGEKVLEALLANAICFSKIFVLFTPDTILLDNTVVQTVYRKKLLKQIKQHRTPTVLLPHAPHHSTLTAFTPFDPNGDPLPDFCTFWMPFKHDRTWEVLPTKKAQFAYVGYPGLDTDWLTSLTTNRPTTCPLRCLFLIRPFQKKGNSNTPGPFVYSYDEFCALLGTVEEAIKSSTRTIEMVVKPHPSNNFREARAMFSASKLPDWQISYEPVYSILPDIDFVLSLYSTTLLIPAAAGIPVMLLHSSAQEEVNKCPEYKALYSGLHFTLDDNQKLQERFPELLKAAEIRRTSGRWNKDVKHIQSFFPDGAAERCLRELGCA